MDHVPTLILKILKEHTGRVDLFQNKLKRGLKPIVEKQSQSCSWSPWSPPQLWAYCFARYWSNLWFELVGPELSLTYSQRLYPHWWSLFMRSWPGTGDTPWQPPLLCTELPLTFVLGLHLKMNLTSHKVLRPALVFNESLGVTCWGGYPCCESRALSACPQTWRSCLPLTCLLHLVLRDRTFGGEIFTLIWTNNERRNFVAPGACAWEQLGVKAHILGSTEPRLDPEVSQSSGLGWVCLWWRAQLTCRSRSHRLWLSPLGSTRHQLSLNRRLSEPMGAQKHRRHGWVGGGGMTWEGSWESSGLLHRMN